MKHDVDNTARRLASRYTLAEPEEKLRLTSMLAVALEVASKQTRDAICGLLSITYVYPGEGDKPDDNRASVESGRFSKRVQSLTGRGEAPDQGYLSKSAGPITPP